jgi:hypothetical protein
MIAEIRQCPNESSGKDRIVLVGIVLSLAPLYF